MVPARVGRSTANKTEPQLCVPRRRHGTTRLRRCAVGRRARWSALHWEWIALLQESCPWSSPALGITSRPRRCKQGCWVTAPSASSGKSFPLRKAQGTFRSAEKTTVQRPFLPLLFQPSPALKEGLHCTQLWFYKTDQTPKKNNTNQYHPK